MKSITDNLSLQDLLAVLLPGALTVFFIYIAWYDTTDVKALYDFIKLDWTNVVSYFGAAYFVGYVVYVLSSYLDRVYDKIKLWVLNKDKGEPKEPTNTVINFFFPYLWDTYRFIQVIKDFKELKIGTGFDGERHQMIDAYQFAFRWLMFKKTEMYEEAERYLATARFFRSMVFVWAFGAIIWLIKAKIEQKWYALLLLGLCIVSFFTFLNRWRKAHHIAFKNVIILEGLKKDAQ